MKEELISVIVPIYNVEKYLKRCVDSILNQTYKNVEIILIDDGSTDNSGKICDEYALKDTRIKVIHKENGGLSDARNAGLNIMTGKYVTFVDSDDYIDFKFIQTLFTNLKKCNADISCCNMQRFKTNKELRKYKKTRNGIEIFDSIEALNYIFYQKKIDSSVCNKLFKENLFRKIFFPNNRYFEDLAIIYKVILKAKKIVYDNSNLYYYYQRKNSILHEANEKRINDILTNLNEMNQYLCGDIRFEKSKLARSINIYFYIYRETNNKLLKKEMKKLIKISRTLVLKDKYINQKTKIGIIISFISFPLVNILFRIKTLV